MCIKLVGWRPSGFSRSRALPLLFPLGFLPSSSCPTQHGNVGADDNALLWHHAHSSKYVHNLQWTHTFVYLFPPRGMEGGGIIKGKKVGGQVSVGRPWTRKWLTRPPSTPSPTPIRPNVSACTPDASLQMVVGTVALVSPTDKRYMVSLPWICVAARYRHRPTHQALTCLVTPAIQGQLAGACLAGLGSLEFG